MTKNATYCDKHVSSRKCIFFVVLGVDHWTAVKNILKYLKTTKDMFLVYGGDKEIVVNGYVDARFGTDPDVLNRIPDTCLY